MLWKFNNQYFVQQEKSQSTYIHRAYSTLKNLIWRIIRIKTLQIGNLLKLDDKIITYILLKTFLLFNNLLLYYWIGFFKDKSHLFVEFY